MADFDGDDDLDVYVANDYFDDCLLENDDQEYRDVAKEAGVADGAYNAMGVALGDIDSDGDLDIAVTDAEALDVSPGNAVYLTRPRAHSR